MPTKTVKFGVFCPHCGRNLRDEPIVDESRPTTWRTFFYTESDHQLAYDGARLVSVSCLDQAEAEPA